MTVVRHLRSKPALQAILYIPAILGLIILSSISIRWSLADVYATQVGHHLETANRDSSNKSAEQWRLARQHLDSALERRSAYARYFELAEKFYQKLDGLESRRIPLIQELAWNDNESKALDYARLGLRLTPSWPYMWNRLMFSKLLLKQFDNELASAIERAINLGAWEQSVQYGIAIVGLNYWSFLNNVTRLYVLQSIEQILLMDQITHNKVYDIKKLLFHPNFYQTCQKQAINTTYRLLNSYCP